MDIRLTTYRDLLDHAIDYLGTNPGGDASRDARRAVHNALQEYSSEKRWSYYYSRGLIVTNPPQTAGTIQYTASTRTVTLTGATWPTYADQCSIVLALSNGQAVYEVASILNSTNLILSRSQCPPADIAAGSTYTLYQDTYPLPVDCLAIDRQILYNNVFALIFEHPGVWLERQRIFYSPAIPRTYTVTGSPDFIGSMVVRYFPPPDSVYNMGFIYQRRPRALRTELVTSGKVAIIDGQATVTGTGVAWSSRMVGSVLRLSGDGINQPTSRFGTNPAYYERIVSSVQSSNQLTADAVFDQTSSGLLYTMSDPVDIEEGAMLAALLRCIEKQVSASRNKEARIQQKNEQLYRDAVIKAMEADARSFAAEVAGPSNPYPYRLAQMPRGPDVS